MVLLRESGMTPPAIAEAMGVSLSTVNRAHMAYDGGGIAALPRRFLLIRPYFSRGGLAQRTSSRTASITATAGLGHHPSSAIKELRGSRFLGFHYLAPIDETNAAVLIL